jgi:hypothetical protein
VPKVRIVGVLSRDSCCSLSASFARVGCLGRPLNSEDYLHGWCSSNKYFFTTCTYIVSTIIDGRYGQVPRVTEKIQSRQKKWLEATDLKNGGRVITVT